MQYEDIIHMPHHVSTTRPRMSAIDRAAQFSPFAALTGYEDAVQETARITDRRVELDEYEKAALNEQLSQLQMSLQAEQKNLEPKDIFVEIIYFQPDEKKEGGSYQTIRGIVKKLDEYERVVVMKDGRRIEIDAVVSCIQ